MRRTISTATQAPSIVIVQSAYEKFCVPEETVALYGNACGFGVILAFDEPAAIATPEDWRRFESLVAAWRQERGAMSSITDAATRPAYQSIIGMGPIAIPMILATLQAEGNEPDQWFWALKALTDVDPVDDEDRGNYRAMAASWINWGKRAGYAR